MFKPMHIDDIGFGRVETRISVGGKDLSRGEHLSHEVLARMPVANRNALIENRKIVVFPKSVAVRGAPGSAAKFSGGQLYVVARGFGKYDVVEGVAIAHDLSKEDAEAFAKKTSAKSSKEASEKTPKAEKPAKARRSPAKKKSAKKASAKRAPARRAASKVTAEQQNGPIDG